VSPEDYTLNDKASGIFNSFMAFGAIIAPVLGGFLTDHIGYRYANDFVAIMASGYTVTFILVYLLCRKVKYPEKKTLFSSKGKSRGNCSSDSFLIKQTF
jgi:MFS family permease